MATVSIIVPIYNVERYLEKCIESILQQTYSNWELLLIDDGSKDSSGCIADKYSNLDCRIFVYHNDNGGVSKARNFGVSKANGKYILFIDSDDTIENNYVEALVKAIETENVDIAICGIKDVWQNKVISRKIKGDLTFNISEDYEILLPLVKMVFAKIYKTNIVKEHKIMFPDNISFAEDQMFNYIYYMYVKHYALALDTNYFYYRRTGTLSDTNKLRNDKQFYNYCIKLKCEKQFFYNNKIDNKESIIAGDIFLALFRFINLSSFKVFFIQCEILKNFFYEKKLCSTDIGIKRWIILQLIKRDFYRIVYWYLLVSEKCHIS